MSIKERFNERFGERAEEAARRMDERREELSRRAEEIRAQFAEHVQREQITGFVGWTLISTGLAVGVTGFVRGQRRFRHLVLPIGLVAFGAAVLAGSSAWDRRAAHIAEAETRVREQIDALDPLARMQVLRDVGKDSMPEFVRRIPARN
jgi:hypothetical protein